MGHKVHPKIHRTPFIFAWDSKWYARPGLFPKFLEQDVAIRKYLGAKLKDAGVDSISVERSPKETTVNILAAKPGAIVGRSGQGLDVLRTYIEKNILQFKSRVKLNILALRNPALSAQVVGQNAVAEIEKRMPFRRVMKQAIEKVMAAGAQGVKIRMSGRLNGVEIARTEVLSAGKMSLITFRSDVDFAIVEAQTIFGKIGVKVWIYMGEAFATRDKFAKAQAEAEKNKK